MIDTFMQEINTGKATYLQDLPFSMAVRPSSLTWVAGSPKSIPNLIPGAAYNVYSPPSPTNASFTMDFHLGNGIPVCSATLDSSVSKASLGSSDQILSHLVRETLNKLAHQHIAMDDSPLIAKIFSGSYTPIEMDTFEKFTRHLETYLASYVKSPMSMPASKPLFNLILEACSSLPNGTILDDYLTSFLIEYTNDLDTYHRFMFDHVMLFIKKQTYVAFEIGRSTLTKIPYESRFKTKVKLVKTLMA